MRKRLDLNSVLLITGLCLAGQFLVSLARPDHGSAAWAQVRSSNQNAKGVLPPNAWAQRVELINEVKALRAEVARLGSKLESGGISVRIENIDELKTALTKPESTGSVDISRHVK